ncbi:MAG: peptide chain release factor N(5)-glutamine methyltransferase [Lachnospiraceae bacterium]|nr:peptide chain release factor N(5)-glutamine methyltransferase [Lachnospiraceae bacterium]
MTLRDCLKSGERELAAAGVPEAALDAWYLLEHVTGLNRACYFLRQNEAISAGQEENFRALIRRRAQRVPLQHLTGETEFMGLSFAVDTRVLIPRQDTEKLVELVLDWAQGRETSPRVVDGKLPGGSSQQALDRAQKGEAPLRALDLCTGSGCIAVSLAKLGHFTSVVGADLSEEALAVARENGRRNGCENLTFRQSDLFQAFAGERFEVITANPPYIPTAEIGKLMPEVRDHDPRMALDGREDGLYFYRRLAAESPAHLTSGGRIFWEIGWNQGEDVRRMLTDAGFKSVEVFPDEAGLDRVITGEWICLTD